MKTETLDVAFLAVIAEKRPDLMDHDDIRKMAAAITKSIAKNGEMQAAAVLGRAKRASAGKPAKRRASRKRRARGKYNGGDAAAAAT